ncbi:lysophospholipid acyltransferase family protein [Roseomonas haemaphysalidis]|uniref:1-acyl-sn-glycerol-3-phosphate acyltransferase n=1 Tax=Roseomonas haemaphysalidis TaxID=2768162 RepID=A0ABS3KV63_9PROT|nr:lysophospholipid acyltransferase family protein [Roseomonas haemaphysalidis]MBO1081372.1 1-acyl-sn-glycerol-3-phosphate acyltransferase [Roseomonas haemaphysalidis]
MPDDLPPRAPAAPNDPLEQPRRPRSAETDAQLPDAPVTLPTLLRSAVFNALFFLLTALCVSFGMLLLPFHRNILRRYVQGWAHLMLWVLRVVCGIRVRVTGREHLPDGPAVIAAKHQSAFDTIIWLALLRDPVYVLKRELLRIPVWGRMARKYGAIAVDRAGGATALKRMVREAGAAAAEGSQIIIFPEGTRTQPGQRVPYLPGVVALGAAVGRPIIPAATDSGVFWGRRAFAKRPGVLTVAVLPPLPAGLPRAALLAQMQQLIETESERLLPPGYPLPAPQPVDNSVG